MRIARRRLLVVAHAALALAAGCTGAGPTRTPAPPPATAPPASTAEPTTAPPTAAPTPACPADPATAGGWLDIQIIDHLATLELRPGDLGPAATITPYLVEVEGTLLGGPATVSLGVEGVSGDVEPTLTNVTADFVPFEATTPEAVEATVDGRTARLALPDRDVRGVLRVQAAWRTSCGAGAGGGSIGLELLDSSVAAGCPTSHEGLLAQVRALQSTTLRVGGLDVPIGIVGWSGRWMAASAIDDFPQFSGWDTAIAATVESGQNLPVKDRLGDGIDFRMLRFAFFERDAVLEYLADELIEVPVVDLVRKNPSATGGVSVPLEFAPGEYVVEIQGTWQTPCLNLDSYAVLSVLRR